MARLNTHLSATPQPPSGRASTVDSLYRGPTPASQLHGAGTARQSSYSVMSPAQSMNSDKENEMPGSRENTPRPHTKGIRAAGGRTQRPPTPDSGSAGNANKRRRTGDYAMGYSDIYEDEDADAASTAETNDFEQEDQGPATPEDEDEEGGTRFYNPHQDPDKRRELRASIRNNQREIDDNRDEIIKPGPLLMDRIKRQNVYMGKVRQTAEAALDSRVLVTLSDLSGKKLNASLHGNNGVGIDLDQFVSKVIFFMKEGRPAGSDEAAAPTQVRNRRQTAVEDDEEEDDVGDGLDWAFLGRTACFPGNKRPPVSSFLLGPLSVQKRVRQTQPRRARSQRQPLGPATRPQEIRHEDIKQSENSNLTHLVTTIKQRLLRHLQDGMDKVTEELTEYGEDVEEEDVEAACRRHRVAHTPAQEAAVSLLDFVINPRSFGQTVENLFYISFLIREGNAGILDDDSGLPLLVPAKPRTIAQQREEQTEKHQAIFSIDWPTWKAFIEAYDIKEPLIPHREPAETNVAAGGWYG